MKKHFLALLEIMIALSFLSACSSVAEVNKLAQDIRYDVNQLDLQGESEEIIERKEAEAFQEINKMPQLDQVIGTIEKREINAREVELYALKMKRKGSSTPYGDAWRQLLLESNIEELAAQYKIDVDSEVRGQIEWTRKELMEGQDSESVAARNYSSTQISALGLTEEEYWKDYRFKAMRAAVLKSRVEGYLASEGKTISEIELAKGTITNDEYLKKVENE